MADKAAAFQAGYGYDAYDGVSAYLCRLRAVQAGRAEFIARLYFLWL